MYDGEVIKTYNDALESYDTALEAVFYARKKSIGFDDRISYDGSDKCAIHLRAEMDHGTGCSFVDVGSHPSIQAVYSEDGIGYCHAEDGCRIIDAEFALEVKRLREKFLRAAWGGASWFMKRYMRGAAVEWQRYGKGYCYLIYIDSRVRSRVARILGPRPSVVDTLRFASVVGNWSMDGIRIQEVAEGVYHADGCPWSPMCSMRSALRALMLVKDGGVIGGEIDDDKTSKDQWFNMCGYEPVLFSAREMYRWGVTAQEVRLSRIQTWLRSVGIMIDSTLTDLLLVVTSGGVAIPSAAGNMSRVRVKMWQIYGDLLCKQHMLMHALTGDESPGTYADAVSSMQSNKSMAQALVNSALYSACAVEGLKKDSKALADIVEGVIGVIGLVRQPMDVRKALVGLGLVYKVVVRAQCSDMEDPGVGEVMNLNSRQWMIVNQMIRDGKL